MKIDTLVQKQIESSITHHVDVAVTLSSIQVEEVSSSKYAEITGIAHKKIKQWCLNGTLAVHTSNDPGGKKICTGDAAGYICINRPKGRNETIKIWSIPTNDQSIPNRTLSKSITWSR
ncbi:hypothetical protein HOB87_15385, partial [Candidatus Woesearchaeota archaeon]|nr:hypothetical protein [Candidatus Woesearchaeota archaeon]